MWLTLILIGLIIGITVRQASQGAHAALVTTALTCCCAACAVGTYEWIAIHWLAPRFNPDYALAIALGVTFGVPLVVLRLTFDQLAKRVCVLPVLFDRIGGAVCGAITAMTMVGIFALCLQMLPFDNGKILGFERISIEDSAGNDPDEGSGQNELLLRPDRFALDLASALSTGIFSSAHDMETLGPDLIEVIGWVGATRPGVTRFAPPGSINVIATKPIEAVYKMTPEDTRHDVPAKYEAEPPAGGREFRAVLVKLGNKARDKHNSHLFSLRQFRLVGRVSGADSLEQYHPIAIRQQEEDDPIDRHIRSVKHGSSFRPVLNSVYTPFDMSAEVEIVFELPSDFKPTYLEYKREARARLSFDESSPSDTETHAAPPPPKQLASAPATAPNRENPSQTTGRRSGRSRRSRASTSSSEPGRRRRGGNVRGVATNPGASRFSNEMPLTLTSYRRLKNAELSGDRIVSGHLVGVVREQSGGTDTPISKFEIPDDKRLLQLSSIRLQARSGLGKIFTQAITTLQNYYVEDARGRQYKIIGKYAIADVRGQKMVEVQYFSNPIGAIGGLNKFDRIDEKKLDSQDTFMLLFLVDPGAHIVTFSTGGAATRAEDLSTENLVAPK